MKATQAQELMLKLDASTQDIAFLHRIYHDTELLPDHPNCAGSPRSIEYVGITKMSIHLHFKDGSRLVVSNPQFSDGLAIRAEGDEQDG